MVVGGVVALAVVAGGCRLEEIAVVAAVAVGGAPIEAPPPHPPQAS